MMHWLISLCFFILVEVCLLIFFSHVFDGYKLQPVNLLRILPCDYTGCKVAITEE